MKQLELFSNNWGLNSGFKKLSDKLNELLPAQGRCSNPNSKNKYLDKFRRMQNAAYDFFNNGLCNKRDLFVREFGQDIDSWNIPSYRDFRYFTNESYDQWEATIESKFTPIIIKAAKEQEIA